MKRIGVRIAVVLGLIGLLWACEKKSLPAKTENSKPEFYFDAQVNGERVYLVAGEESYFMYSSYYLDTNRVYVLSANLRQTNCNTQCGYAITVLINDKKTSEENEPIAIHEALKTGLYAYNDQLLPPLFYKAVLKPLRKESAAENFRWVLDDKVINAYSTSTVLESGKTFTPTLYFEDAEGCSASHSKQYRVGNPLQSLIEVQKEGLPDVLMYSFSSSVKGSPPYQYTWQFGDGTPASHSENPFHSYKNQGFFNAKLSIVDANHDTCVSFYQVPAFVDPRCEANFTTTFMPLPNTKAYSAVTVMLTHPDGRTYSSKVLGQSADERFEILEVSDYELNSKNEKTKKIKIRFNCTVQNGADQLKITTAEAVLAVSFK
ncbi:MAG: PKD domain-containing protein [Bacteroidia bacterium]|jgi:hypothetical protein|nr:PKD domain-containing protein [Bacteroidia bacterium]